MAGTKISEYGVGDVNLTALMSAADTQRRGYCAVSLTNYDTDDEPAIAEGSVIEVNGALFEFQADESIGGSPSDGTVYIKVIPSGSSCTAEFDNDAPAWDDERQGWYESGTNNRYLPFAMTLDTGSYYEKRELYHYGTPVYGYLDDGTPILAKIIDISIPLADKTAQQSHGISNAVTEDRIISIQYVLTVGTSCLTYNYMNVPQNIEYLYVDDSNLHVVKVGTGPATYVYRFLILYKAIV